MSAVPVEIHIGTSGWSYDHWRGPFYPEHHSDSRMLDYYAQRLGCVEINSSFYHLPAAQTLQHWYDSTPDKFLFAVKASRYITHMKKLRDAEATVPALLGRVGTLGDKLGPILFQLPPHWRFNATRLAGFLDGLSPEFRYAFEFRDRSWINDHTCELLSAHAAAFCIYELDGFLAPQQVTSDFVYVRLHGPGAAYQGSYDERTLAGWAERIFSWASSGLSIHCYFDNDQHGHAVNNALRLQALLDRSGVTTWAESP